MEYRPAVGKISLLTAQFSRYILLQTSKNTYSGVDTADESSTKLQDGESVLRLREALALKNRTFHGAVDIVDPT